MIADRWGTVRRIYADAGIDLDAQAEAVMRAHDAEQRRRRRAAGGGKQPYTLAEFGLEETAVRQRFREYTTRFGVQPEVTRLG